MAGLSLVLDLDGRTAFDVEVLTSCVKGLRETRNWTQGLPGYLFMCEFNYAGDVANVYMTDDPRYVAIEGLGDASLRAAMEIQKCYPVDMHAVDLECSFDIPLHSVTSIADFNDKIARHVGIENLETNEGE